jgi:thiamine-monophosphate kinase
MTKEHDLINRYFAPLCSKSGTPPAFGLTDDAALLPPDQGLGHIVTTDMLVAGRHFFANDRPRDIAYKALAVNVSDMVAKGGRPRFYLLSIALPENTTLHWLEEFSQGLVVSQKIFDCQLVGGDTVSTTGPLTINITLTGHGASEKGPPMVLRSGANEGDIVFVSGTIGDAALGLLERQDDERFAIAKLDTQSMSHFRQSYLRPSPDIALAPMIARYASAAMDISDGLMGDFAKLCAASNVGGQLYLGDLPLSEPTRRLLKRSPALIQTVLGGGDDYQVLATIPSPVADRFIEQVSKQTVIQVRSIGLITERECGVMVLNTDGNPLKIDEMAYDHLASLE